jgi:alkylation response protein AidB-like acyl-CoA dehydrogenase
MDLAPSAEQRMLAEAARAVLARACPIGHVRDMERDPRGFSPAVWRELAGLGWPGMLGPPAARPLLDAVFVVEEMGRALLPSPFLPTAVVAVPLLAELATGAQQDRWVAAIAAGQAIATLALVEPGWTDEWGTPALAVRADGEGFRLDGRKMFVPFAAQADLLLVVVRAEDGGPGIALVGAGAPGLAHERLTTLGGDPCYAVGFDGVRLGRDGLRAGAGPALARARLRGTVASLAYAAGAAERALEMTVEYARTRVQFGRPIGSFQAVAHRCVDMRTDLDALRYLVYQAAWTLDAGRPADLEVSAAKAWGSEALRRIAMHAHQVHGAIGFSTECDLQLFTRQLKARELAWGSAASHRERVARAMGL